MVTEAKSGPGARCFSSWDLFSDTEGSMDEHTWESGRNGHQRYNEFTPPSLAFITNDLLDTTRKGQNTDSKSHAQSTKLEHYQSSGDQVLIEEISDLLNQELECPLIQSESENGVTRGLSLSEGWETQEQQEQQIHLDHIYHQQQEKAPGLFNQGQASEQKGGWVQEDTPLYLEISMVKDEAVKNPTSKWVPLPSPHSTLGDGSSLDIFLGYCKYFGDCQNAQLIQVDAKDIFSRQCFEQWLSTRQKSLKRPEESFRKTVTAHTQGTDGRKPFPPEVEKAVLEQLRLQKVWPCFQGFLYQNGERINIGLQGFRGQGYHEAKAIDMPPTSRNSGKASPKKNQAVAISLAPDSKDTFGENTERDGKRKRQGEPESKEERTNANIFANIQEWKRNPHLIRVMAKTFETDYHELFDDNGFSDVLEGPNVDRTLEILGPNVQPKTVGAAVMCVLTRFFLPQHFLSMVSISTAMRQERIFSKKYLKLSLAITDPRFDLGFLLPNDGLLPGLPIAKNIFCLNTYMYISCDEVSKSVMEGDSQGTVAQQFVHPLHYWMIVLQIVPRLMRAGELVWQAYTSTLRGRPIITRTHYTLVGTTIHTAFQDVTHIFPEIMALPDLDDVIDEFLESQN